MGTCQKIYFSLLAARLYVGVLSFLFRIANDESLLNPANHIQYRLESDYYQCGCPPSTDKIPSRVKVYEDEWSSTQHVYTGALSCNLDQYCTDVQDGAGKMIYKHDK